MGGTEAECLIGGAILWPDEVFRSLDHYRTCPAAGNTEVRGEAPDAMSNVKFVSVLIDLGRETRVQNKFLEILLERLRVFFGNIRSARWFLYQHASASHETKEARRSSGSHLDGVHVDVTKLFFPSGIESSTLDWSH